MIVANLTGHAEKVGRENFELLKVLGTGGKTHVHVYRPAIMAYQSTVLVCKPFVSACLKG